MIFYRCNQLYVLKAFTLIQTIPLPFVPKILLSSLTHALLVNSSEIFLFKISEQGWLYFINKIIQKGLISVQLRQGEMLIVKEEGLLWYSITGPQPTTTLQIILQKRIQQGSSLERGSVFSIVFQKEYAIKLYEDSQEILELNHGQPILIHKLFQTKAKACFLICSITKGNIVRLFTLKKKASGWIDHCTHIFKNNIEGKIQFMLNEQRIMISRTKSQTCWLKQWCDKETKDIQLKANGNILTFYQDQSNLTVVAEEEDLVLMQFYKENGAIKNRTILKQNKSLRQLMIGSSFLYGLTSKNQLLQLNPDGHTPIMQLQSDTVSVLPLGIDEFIVVKQKGCFLIGQGVVRYTNENLDLSDCVYLSSKEMHFFLTKGYLVTVDFSLKQINRVPLQHQKLVVNQRDYFVVLDSKYKVYVYKDSEPQLWLQSQFLPFLIRQESRTILIIAERDGLTIRDNRAEKKYSYSKLFKIKPQSSISRIIKLSEFYVMVILPFLVPFQLSDSLQITLFFTQNQKIIAHKMPFYLQNTYLCAHSLFSVNNQEIQNIKFGIENKNEKRLRQQKKQSNLRRQIQALIQLDMINQAKKIKGQFFKQYFSFLDESKNQLDFPSKLLRWNQSNTTSNLVWAFLSEDKDYLQQLYKLQGQYAVLKSSGFIFWCNNLQSLKRQVQKIGEVGYRKNKNPYDSLLWYLLVGKRKIASQLFRNVQQHKKIYQFLNRNFQDEKNKQAAIKNAFSLLEKRRFHDSISFFLVGGNWQDAISIALNNLKDFQLAYLMTRLCNQQNIQIIQQKLLDSLYRTGQVLEDVWLRILVKLIKKDIRGALQETILTVKKAGQDQIISQQSLGVSIQNRMNLSIIPLSKLLEKKLKALVPAKTAKERDIFDDFYGSEDEQQEEGVCIQSSIDLYPLYTKILEYLNKFKLARAASLFSQGLGLKSSMTAISDSEVRDFTQLLKLQNYFSLEQTLQMGYQMVVQSVKGLQSFIQRQKIKINSLLQKTIAQMPIRLSSLRRLILYYQFFIQLFSIKVVQPLIYQLLHVLSLFLSYALNDFQILKMAFKEEYTQKDIKCDSTRPLKRLFQKSTELDFYMDYCDQIEIIQREYDIGGKVLLHLAFRHFKQITNNKIYQKLEFLFDLVIRCKQSQNSIQQMYLKKYNFQEKSQTYLFDILYLQFHDYLRQLAARSPYFKLSELDRIQLLRVKVDLRGILILNTRAQVEVILIMSRGLKKVRLSQSIQFRKKDRKQLDDCLKYYEPIPKRTQPDFDLVKAAQYVRNIASLNSPFSQPKNQNSYSLNFSEEVVSWISVPNTCTFLMSLKRSIHCVSLLTGSSISFLKLQSRALSLDYESVRSQVLACQKDRLLIFKLQNSCLKQTAFEYKQESSGKLIKGCFMSAVEAVFLSQKKVSTVDLISRREIKSEQVSGLDLSVLDLKIYLMGKKRITILDQSLKTLKSIEFRAQLSSFMVVSKRLVTVLQDSQLKLIDTLTQQTIKQYRGDKLTRFSSWNGLLIWSGQEGRIWFESVD